MATLVALGAVGLVGLLPAQATAGPSVDRPSTKLAGHFVTAHRSAASYGSNAFRVSNDQRVNHDRARLKHNDCLQRFAAKQAQRMANQTRMFHQELGPIQQECNVGWVGENVAMGYPSGWSVVVQGWMKSEGHRANILSRHYRLMAVAARKGDDGAWYAAQVFGRKN